jgi:hypothetical protein
MTSAAHPPSRLTAPRRDWQLWARGAVLKTVEIPRPLVASWEANNYPAKIRERIYLDRLQRDLGELPRRAGRLFLHLDIDVREPARLLRHYALENYLTPVANRLGHRHFCLVSAVKRVGGGSRAIVGLAEPSAGLAQPSRWGHFAGRAGSGPASKRWTAALRLALIGSRPAPLPAGPAEVHLAWRCTPSRNWVTLWKPTGDALGPVLGVPDPRNPFNPHDDRIVALGLHLTRDPSMGHEVDVGMAWRAVASERPGMA